MRSWVDVQQGELVVLAIANLEQESVDIQALTSNGMFEAIDNFLSVV